MAAGDKKKDKPRSFGLGDLSGGTAVLDAPPAEQQAQPDTQAPTGSPPPAPTSSAEEFSAPAQQQPAIPTAAPPPAPTASATQFSAQPESTGEPPPAPTSSADQFAGTQAQPQLQPSAQIKPQLEEAQRPQAQPPSYDAWLAAKQQGATYGGGAMPTRENVGEFPTEQQIAVAQGQEPERFDVRKHLGRLDETNPTASSSDNQDFDNIVTSALSQYPTMADINAAEVSGQITPEVMNKAQERLSHRFANAIPDDRTLMMEAEKRAQAAIDTGSDVIHPKDFSDQHWIWATQHSASPRDETDPVNKGIQVITSFFGIPYNEGNGQLVSSFLASGIPTMAITGSLSSKPLNPNDFDSMRELLVEQRKAGTITADEWKQRDGFIVQAQNKAKNDPLNQAAGWATYGGLGVIQDNRLAERQKSQDQINALVDQALPQWHALRQQQAATEVNLAWNDLAPKLLSGDFVKKYLHVGAKPDEHPYEDIQSYAQRMAAEGKDPTGGPDKTLLEKTPEERAAQNAADRQALQEERDKMKVGPDTDARVKAILDRNNTPTYRQEFMEKFHMDPKEGPVTSLTPLVLATAENLVSTIGMPWEEACMRAYAKIITPVAGGVDTFGAWMEKFGKGIIKSKTAHAIQGTVATITAGHALLNLSQKGWDEAKGTMAADAFGLAAEIGVGAGIWGIGRFGFRGAADILAGSAPSVRIPLRRGAAQAAGYGVEGLGLQGKGAKVAAGEPWLPKVEAFPYRAGQNIVSQLGSRQLEQYVRGAIRTGPIAALTSGNWQNFLRQVNQGGLTNSVMNAPENVFNAFRGSVYDPIYTYKGEKPGKTTIPPQVLHGDDPVVGNLDSTVTSSLKRMDESRRAGALNLQNFASKWADVRYLPDTEFDRVDQLYNGRTTGSKGFIAKPQAPGQKMQMFIRESQFDTAGPHEYGHLLQAILDPHDQQLSRYVAMKINGKGGLDRAANSYAGKSGVTGMDYASLPTEAQVTPGNPQFDPAKKTLSQSMGNLTQERLLDEITADNLGQLAVGKLNEMAQNKAPGLRRQIAKLTGSIAEKLRLPTTTPDVNGPLGFRKGVIYAKLFDNYLDSVAQHKVPAPGAGPGQLNLKALSEIPGPPLQMPKGVLTAAKAVGAAIWSPYFGHSTSLMPAGTPGGPPLAAPGAPGAFQQSNLGPQPQPQPQPQQDQKRAFEQRDLSQQGQPPETKPPEGFQQSDLQQPPPARHIDLSERLPGQHPAAQPTVPPTGRHIELSERLPTIVTPQAEKKEPVANQGQQEKAPQDESIQGQTQKVTATEFGWIDRAAVAKHPEKYPSGNKGYPDFGGVDLSGENAEGVSLPPEDINKQMGNVMHKDANGVWHADPQFAQDVRNHKIMIEVTNPETGKKAMAPLIDIGPMKSTGAGIDVLHKTAQDVGFTSGKATLHYRIAGGHTADTAPETVGPNEVARAALDNVGKLNTTQDAGTNNGELACADAVVRILRDQMHLNVPRTLATAELYDYMREPKNGWKSVPLNTPGAVIISPTQGGAHGHVGIVGKDGKVYSNSSSNGNWGQNYTTESWSRQFSSLGMYAFVPTDQVGRVKPGEEGEVAKEGGGGRKGKGSPTDILTGMGDEATAAGAAAAGGEIPPLWKSAAGAPAGVQYPVEQPQGGAAGAGAEQVPAQQYYGGGGYGGGGGYRPMPAAAAEEYVGGGGGGGFGGGGASVRFMPGAPGGKGRRQVGGIPLEGGEEGDTSGVPNPGGDLVRSHLATGNLPEAVKAHAQSLSGNDTRVKKQADNLFKGEHFQAGDQLHTHVLSNVPDHEKQVLSQAQNAIANKTAMHVAYVSAPKEGLEPVPTTRSRQVEYGMSSPQARILGQAKAQIAGHSFIPTSIGVSLAKKRGDPHQGYIQGISTNAAANNHHHLNSELTSMGQQSPYPQLDEKFNRDLHGYVSNLNAGHKGTGEGPAEGTEQYPNSFDETHVPHRLKRNEADFINAVINNQAAKAKSAEGLRELAKKGGTLLSEEGETNPIRHAIDMRQAGIREELARHPNNINNPVIQKAAQRLWSQDTLEPTIRSFKAGLIQHVHDKPEDLEEGIRPGQEFKGLTEALQRAHAERLGRPDVPTSVSFMPGKASPAALLRNRAINNIERDYAEGRAEEPEVHEKLQSIGEDPSRYRFLEKHGLVSPHEERPEALTVEEHGQLTSNLRQQWIGGKLSTKEYRSRIAELPLPEKPSTPPTATPPEESPAPSAVAFMPGKAKAGVLQKPDWETANEATRQKYLKTRVKQVLANQSTDESAIPLKALKNDDGSYKYDPQGNPTFDKPGYNIVNSPLLKKKGLDQLDDADNHEDTIDPEQHGHLNFTERRRLSALRHASAVETMGNRILKSYNAIKDIPEIAAGKGWYSSMRDKLSKALGPDNEIFAQLLGATSAKTPVRSNFIQALDAYEQWKRGDFDRHAQKYLEAHHKMEEGDGALTQHMRDLGILGDNDPDHKTEAHAMAHWIEHHDILPKQQTGAKYNANSNAVLKVLAGTWLKEADAPKTPNFAGNLTGRTKEATIDVWAARHIKRLGHEGLTGGKPWRDQAKGESGVSGLDFAFGQDAMRHAADKIGINPDDLQAILWYAEKHHYEQQGWTRGEGAKKASFDDVFDKVFHKSGEPMSSKELRDHYAEEANVARKLAGKVKTARKYHEAGSPKLAPYMEKHGLTQEHLGTPEEEEEEAA